MKTLLCILSSCALATAHGAVTFFNTELDFDLISDSYAKSGITVTLSANQGTINSTATSLGINSPGAGDATDELDVENGVEILTISFDFDVIFQSLNLTAVGGSDSLDITFEGLATQNVNSTGTTTFNQFLAAGNTLVISSEPMVASRGNGVGIVEFSVEAVPEPSSTLLILAGIPLLVRRRRKSQLDV